MPAVRLMLVGVSLALAVPAAAAPPDPDALRARADKAEAAADWDKALELHLKAYLGGRKTDEQRAKVHDCVRRSAQAKRHRDPAFQQFVTSLEPADALNLYAEAVQKLSTHYADRERCRPERLFALGVEEFDRALADPTFRTRHLPDAATADVTAFRKKLTADWMKRTPATARAARQELLDLAAAAQAKLKLENASAVACECLCGACNGLDEYTVYLSPHQLRSDLATPVVELAGYGVLIAFKADVAVVEAVVPDSYAAIHTGLRPGDRIVRANGRAVTGAVSLAEALRTPADGLHELETAPGSGMPPTGKAVLPTPVPTVLRADVVNTKDGVGYVRISGFRETTPSELDAAIARLREKAMPLRAVVLDLRANTGGHFAAGVATAKRFVPAGILVTTRGQAPEVADRVFSSDSGMDALDVPVVVLVDGRTMSAAEIVAAALQAHGRGVLVGMPTFGKGVVQCPVRLSAADADPAPGSGLLIVTIAKAFSPRGEPIHGTGLLPDVAEADPHRQLAVALERAAAMANGMR